MPQSAEVEKLIKDEEIDYIGMDRYDNYEVRIYEEDVKNKREVIVDLIERAFQATGKA